MFKWGDRHISHRTEIRERPHAKCGRSAVSPVRPGAVACDDFSLSPKWFSMKDAVFGRSCATLQTLRVSICSCMHRPIPSSCRRRRRRSSRRQQTWSCGQKFCRIIATSEFLERGPDRNIVVMAATRSGIPISWTSEQIIDRDKFEIRFHHLKAWTKGMRVVWTFSDKPEWRAGSDFTRFAISHSRACADCRSNHWRFFHP